MEGLDDSFNDIPEHRADCADDDVVVQEWAEVDLETDYENATYVANDEVPAWLVGVNPEEITDAEVLREIRSMVVGDPCEAPDEGEGHQKVKRW